MPTKMFTPDVIGVKPRLPVPWNTVAGLMSRLLVKNITVLVAMSMVVLAPNPIEPPSALMRVSAEVVTVVGVMPSPSTRLPVTASIRSFRLTVPVKVVAKLAAA